MNSCSKSYFIVNKTVLQFVNVGQLWCLSLTAFLHCTPSIIIHWHIYMVHFLLFLDQNLSLITCSLRENALVCSNRCNF